MANENENDNECSNGRLLILIIDGLVIKVQMFYIKISKIIWDGILKYVLCFNFQSLHQFWNASRILVEPSAQRKWFIMY